MFLFSDIDAAVVFESTTHNNNNEPLNKGQSYLVTVKSYKPGNLANRDALLGALVSADKPVVVNCGSFSGSSDEILNSNSRDAGIDQIVPLERVGKEYLFIRAQGEDENERPLIVAHEDNTEVFLNGATSANRILNAGEYWSIPGTEYSSFTKEVCLLRQAKKFLHTKPLEASEIVGIQAVQMWNFFLCLQLMMIHHVLLIIYQMEVKLEPKLYNNSGRVVIIAEQLLMCNSMAIL